MESEDGYYISYNSWSNDLATMNIRNYESYINFNENDKEIIV